MKPGIYRCIKDYHSPYPDSILFNKDEKVQIGEKFEGDPDWKDWIRCQAPDSREAWIPGSYLRIDENIGFLLRDYDARELSISIGDVLEIREIVNGFGLAEKKDGVRGWVPMNHLQADPDHKT
jgi:hypothetical protein